PSRAAPVRRGQDRPGARFGADSDTRGHERGTTDFGHAEQHVTKRDRRGLKVRGSKPAPREEDLSPESLLLRADVVRHEAPTPHGPLSSLNLRAVEADLHKSVRRSDTLHGNFQRSARKVSVSADLPCPP